jgi:predicted short-subunit dehydrogenase-like oxidoreductase (DUF2520 family)
MAASQPARLAVGVVGTGRVGAVLGAALTAVGHRVVAASGVSAASRQRAEQLLPGVRLMAPDQVVQRADLVLLTVPDDVLPQLVAGLANARVVRSGQLIAHMSGRHGVSVLEPVVRAGAGPLALHPVMTFTGTRVDLARLAGASFGVTAPDVLRPVAEALVVEVGAEPVWIEEQHRALYHAALAHAANHLVTLTSDAMDLLEAAGVERPGSMLGPLLSAALDNALRSGDAALTGPVVRGDAGTVAAHLDVIGRYAPDAVDAYVAMARRTADRAMGSGRLKPSDAEALLDVLADRTEGRYP